MFTRRFLEVSVKLPGSEREGTSCDKGEGHPSIQNHRYFLNTHMRARMTRGQLQHGRSSKRDPLQTRRLMKCGNTHIMTVNGAHNLARRDTRPFRQTSIRSRSRCISQDGRHCRPQSATVIVRVLIAALTWLGTIVRFPSKDSHLKVHVAKACG
eukprot:5873321-Pleurochrysis_carterae.AAC.1